MNSVFSRALQSLRKFRVAHGGNVAITFAIATLPIAGAVGAAVDYSHASSVKAALQSALDSTALMVSKNAATVSNGVLQTETLAYFKALFTKPEATNLNISAVYSASGGSNVVVTGSVSVPTNFVAIMGKQFASITVNGSSTVKWGTSRLRVALVLDTTGSMANNNKLTALQAATNSLLTQLQTAATTNGDVYVSIIPFSRGVNLDNSNYNATWIDWTDWAAAPAYMSTWLSNTTNSNNWDETGPGSSCPWSSNGNSTGFACQKTPTNGSSTTNTIPSSGTYSGYICPTIDGGNVDTTKLGVYYNGCYNSTAATRTISSGSGASCGSTSNCSCTGSGSGKTCKQSYFTHSWIANATSTWNGCIKDRGSSTAPGTTAGNDQTVTAPTTSDKTTLFPAWQDSFCPPAEVSELSYNWTSMASTVNSLQANGSTNQPIGLVNGWQSLAGIGPYTAPAMDPNYTYTQVIILLTDGLNTQDRWYGDGSTTNTSVDYRMYSPTGTGTCANIKAAGITIYTIQVNTEGDPTSTLLQNCASDSTKFFLLTSSTQIMSVFNSIGTNLTNLYVAK